LLTGLSDKKTADYLKHETHASASPVMMRRGAAKEEQKTEKSRCDPPCEKAGDVRWSKNRQNKNYKTPAPPAAL